MKSSDCSVPMTKAVGNKVSTKMPTNPPMIKNKSSMEAGIGKGKNFIMKSSK